MKRQNLFIKIIKYLLIISSLLIVVYIGLNLFVKSKEIKVDKNKLMNDTDISLSDEQIKIACLVLYEHMNPEFHNYHFLINDAFSTRNNIALSTANIYIGKYCDIRNLGDTSMEYQIIDLATKRYVMKNIDYKLCYNYVFSNAYFGKSTYLAASNEVCCSQKVSQSVFIPLISPQGARYENFRTNQLYGLKNASEFYFSKNYKDLTSKEFISLCLLINNPHIYDFLEEENKKRFEEKVNEIYMKLSNDN